MPPRTRKARESRPSRLIPGNPAAAAPEDDDEGATGTAGYGDVVDDVDAGGGDVAGQAVGDDEGEQLGDAASVGAAETPEEDAAPAAKGNGAASPRKPRASSTAAKGTAAKGAAAKPAAPAKSPAASEPAAAEGGARAGRPRVPRPGPVTRVTVDLAVTEQQALDKMTGTIGRQIDRATGKRKIYVQSLMRVAARRLISDADFRAAVTADLAENRDELKREK